MTFPATKPGGAAYPLDDFTVFYGPDYIYFEQHWRMYDEVLRVSVRRAARDEQSHAKCEIFNPRDRAWNRFCSLPIAQMDCRAVTYMSNPLKAEEETLLCAAIEELLMRAKSILLATPRAL